MSTPICTPLAVPIATLVGSPSRCVCITCLFGMCLVTQHIRIRSESESLLLHLIVQYSRVKILGLVPQHSHSSNSKYKINKNKKPYEKEQSKKTI